MRTKYSLKWRLCVYLLIVVASSLFVFLANKSACTADSTNELGEKYEDNISSESKAINSHNHMQFILDAPWTKAYGGTGWDEAFFIKQTSDGGYIVAGDTDFGAGSGDALLMKLNATGSIVWRRTFGGTNWDVAYCVQQTSDGGYIVAGYTESFGEGYTDVLVMRLNSEGNILWKRTFGEASYDEAYSVQQTSDGGYIVAGYTESFGAGYADVLVLKLNATGNILWRRTFGGTSYDYAFSVQQTSDGGYIVGGYTSSYGAGSYDVLVLKLNASGNILWRRTYGGTGYDSAHSIQQTSDGGYIIAGHTGSFGAGNRDVLVLKLNAVGNILWRRTFGGTGWEHAYSIQQSSDGGYIIAGRTDSFGAGSYDMLVLKLNSAGNILWKRTFGGTGYDYAYSAQQTSDGGYIVAGWASSFGAGSYDAIVLKFDANGNMPGCSMTAPNLSVTSPSLSAAAPAIGATASDMTITAPVISGTAPAIIHSDICQ